MSTEDRRTEMVLELAEEFLERYRKGERPPLREYVERHPDLASEIREVFPAMAMMEKIAVADDSVEERGHESSGGGKKLTLTQLGDYRIIREIGHGGMGVVYEAEQVSLGRYVALKVLPHKALANEKTKKRFEREAKAAAKLHHTNIVPVFGVGEHDGLPYYAMQFIQGLSVDLVLEELKRLKDRGGKMSQVASLPMSGPISATAIRRDITAADMARSMLTGAFESPSGTVPQRDKSCDANPKEGNSTPLPVIGTLSSSSDSLAHSSGSIALPGQSGTTNAPPGIRRTYWHSVAQTGVQVAEALEYAHKQGIIHRDIKPSNLLLDTSGTIWVTDFGLAKANDRQDLTHVGDVLGTLRYMPPEAFDGKADGRGDIYALGLTLYELLAFRPAFDEKERNRLIKQVTTTEPPRLDRLNPEVPRDLVTIVQKAIARDPAHRYQSPAEMAEDLKRFGEDRPVRARRVSEGERLWRWCRRNPLPAGLAAGIVLTFLTGFLGVFWQMREAVTAREDERGERGRAESQRKKAEFARDEADESRAAAEAETYRARLSEVKALRAGREPGWREKALGELARLAVMPTPRRNLAELRSEAAATLGTPDIRHVATIEMDPGDLASFAFSPDGRTLVTAGRNAGLDFWDVSETWDVPEKHHLFSSATLKVTGNDLDKVKYFPSGQIMAVAAGTDGVVFTDRQGVRTPRAPITQGTSQPTKLAIDANGDRIAIAWSGGAGTTVHDVASGNMLERFKDSNPNFALSPDGKWLARQDDSDIVMLPIGSSEPRIVLGRHGTIQSLSFNAKGTLLAAACLDHTTVIWDVAKCEKLGTLRGHRELVYDVVFSPDGEWIATGSLDYTVRIWETRTNRNIATLTGLGPGRRIQWSPTGEYLAASSNNARSVFLCQVTGRRGVQRWLTGHSRELNCVAAHPRLERIATSGYTELLSWNLSDPNPSGVDFGPNSGAVTSMAYSPEGAHLAVASWPQTADPRHIEIRDANTGKLRGRISAPQIVLALAFDSKGEQLACGDNVGNVVIWNLSTSQPVQTFATDFEVRSIAYLDQEQRLAAHGKEAVFLFNLETGMLEKKVHLAGGIIRSIAASRDGKRLFVGFQGGALASLSLPDLIETCRVGNAHAGSIDYQAVSPDGRLLATGGADHRVVLHDAMTLEPLLGFPVWAGELRNLTFDAKGRRLAVVGTSSDVDLWDLAELQVGLTDLGLAWNQPSRPVESALPRHSDGDRHPTAVPVIRSVPARSPAP